MQDVEEFLIKGGFKEFKLRRLKSQEILFIFKREEDYLRWFHRRKWNIKSSTITLCKWSVDYSHFKDCPVIPVWVEIRNIPLHLSDHIPLYSIASALGKPLKLGRKTAMGIYPGSAKVFVEMDVSFSKPPKIHLRLGTRDLWLPCSYEDHPPFCSKCLRFGHQLSQCRKLTSQAELVGPSGAGGSKQEWKMVMRKVPKPSHDLRHKAPTPDYYSRRQHLFCATISMEEVQKAVWDLDGNSAGGPDGFNGNFFKSAWDTIKQDVLIASQDFFMGQHTPKAYGSTFLTLIPKIDNPKRFEDYRPISLSTFMSKINTKILANRLNTLLPKLISKEQAAFQKGKSIDDHILMAQEAVHLLDKKVYGGNLIIKLDKAKAFDKLDWEYLEALLLRFGFSSLSTSLLMANLNGTLFSILINGEPSGFFKMERGVKQGDPLSPLLFILAAEGFSRLINMQMDTNHLLRFNSGQVLFPSHLIYADDIIIFSRGDNRNLLKLKVTLDIYLKATGQEINLNKSRFYTSKHTTSSQNQRMEKALGIKRGNLPFTYLGAPICKRILRKEHCKDILGHFEKLIHSWYSKTLNQMGRLILIKHVLSSIPLHILAVHTILKSIIHTLNRYMANFLWGQKEGSNKHHWVRWAQITKPEVEGGLRIKSLKDLQQAYTLKLWWKARNDIGIWGSYVRARYMKTGIMKERITNSPTWKRICRSNDLATSHTTTTSPGLLWEGGNFSLKSAFNMVQESGTTLLSCKYIWHSSNIPKIKIFLWRLLNSALPFPKNLCRFTAALPSSCPLCHKDNDDIDHSMLHCPTAKEVWNFMASISNGPRVKENTTLRQHLLAWWFGSSTKHFGGNLRLFSPGLCTWSLWKARNSYIHNAAKPTVEGVIKTCLKTLQAWAWINRNKKWMAHDDDFEGMGLDSFWRNGRRILSKSFV
ncbi:unnamed protein product [Cuscuta campestris]|uniref:Reverse transcriptase domain-containing protein n=1 Tax=Cuscuta campestris TaxID=132261 RepID=A0A484NC21_9ASTE|nr:unnamed protein product [Cuscuta campestris]